ncbi:Dna polymerase theta protein [Thalictrum thalictroides]|uniref:Dna polymerase theta protein n=1 Tax=Thalictrum thalictroides TaxID=46969 RepID=A0A7J6WH45_THATH|nr:Dna polymerase theta protein [Thalictrum thalictroides]
MASDSSRTRIDQFYVARKRKSDSPSLKSERINKDARIALDGSPSGKGTLDSYLVNSQDDTNVGVRGGVSSRQVHIKRNLGFEIKVSSQVSSKECLQPVGELIEDPKESLRSSLAVDDDVVSPVPVQDNDEASAPAENNTELKKFAADFLSLYCSELSSSVSTSSESRSKRNGSPSLLALKGDKKQCVAYQDKSQLDGTAECNKESLEQVKSGCTPKSGEVGSIPSGELDETGRKKLSESHASLKKCNGTTTPNWGIVDCFTPGALVNKTCTRETPKSGRGSSIFSPGEEFWNEAIQVVDGLFDPIDTFSAHNTKDISASRSQCEVKKSCVKDSNVCGDSLKGRLTEDDCIARVSEMKISLEIKEKHSKGGVEFPEVVDKEVSPLPVRHFDFLHEDRNLDEKKPHQHSIDKRNDISYKGGGRSQKESLNYKGSMTANILSRCSKAETKGQCTSEGKFESSVLKTVKRDLVVPSLASNREIHQAQDSELLSVVAESKGKSSHQKNENNMFGTLKKSIGSPSFAQKKHDEAGTPSSSLPLNDYLELSHWLPSEICNIYMKKGISKLYPWQVDCLKVDGVLEKRNLVYCASTSAGKSFVAEILMLRRVISTGKMALLVLPYVSICAEKAEHLEVLLEPLGKHVRSYYGIQGGGTLPKDTSVAVCTIEKANSLVNRLLEEGRLSEVGIIVIDELHMVGDQHRGYLLELMLTKLRYAAGEGNLESSSEESSGTSSGKADSTHGLQIVGMSATMPNVAAVADWLQAALYQTEFRPVPLEEYIKVRYSILDKKMELVRTIPKSADLGGKDPDHIVELCNEVVQEGHSVLIFCSSRKGCESTAKHVSKFIKHLPVSTHDDRSEFSDIYSAIDALRRCPVGLDPTLEETLPSGVAYHHAGLTVEEREIVETCYRKGLLRVLTATSTLAAGVNLPARRVIFRQPRIGRDFIDGTRYRQMAGRAGRTGIDTKGESILLCKPDEVKRITAVLNDSCPPLQSCLSEDKNGMIHAILEVVAGGIVQTAGDINRYVRCTLLNSTKPFEDVVKSAQDSLRWLCNRKFVEWNEDTKMYSTTPLGRASFGSSLGPEESLVVLDDLSRAREGFVLASDLHLVYLVTPINVDVEPDWELYYEKFMQLSALEQSVGNRVGVVEPFLMRMSHGAPLRTSHSSRENKKGLHGRPPQNFTKSNCTPSDEHTLRVCKRFYVALILSRLVQVTFLVL